MEIIFSNNIKNLELYLKLYNESTKVYLDLQQLISQFPKLFDQNFETFYEVKNYLTNNSFPNKYVCAKRINDLQGMC